MNGPALFLGTLIAMLCGFLFHLLRGGSPVRLLLFVATAWISFFTGQLVSTWLNWHVMRFGTLNLFPALLSTAIGLITASVLAGPERTEKRRGRRRNPPRRSG
ncbi:MAG: hypothetical protein GTO14_14805 [Anaerolineales bacterium]|nr:hypothetical protein [Anaerolineales bacterium]